MTRLQAGGAAGAGFAMTQNRRLCMPSTSSKSKFGCKLTWYSFAMRAACAAFLLCVAAAEVASFGLLLRDLCFAAARTPLSCTHEFTQLSDGAWKPAWRRPNPIRMRDGLPSFLNGGSAASLLLRASQLQQQGEIINAAAAAHQAAARFHVPAATTAQDLLPLALAEEAALLTAADSARAGLAAAAAKLEPSRWQALATA